MSASQSGSSKDAVRLVRRALRFGVTQVKSARTTFQAAQLDAAATATSLANNILQLQQLHNADLGVLKQLNSYDAACFSKLSRQIQCDLTDLQSILSQLELAVQQCQQAADSVLETISEEGISQTDDVLPTLGAAQVGAMMNSITDMYRKDAAVKMRLADALQVAFVESMQPKFTDLTATLTLYLAHMKTQPRFHDEIAVTLQVLSNALAAS